MATKLTESQVLERMHAAREDALTSKDPDRARKARTRLRHLIERYRIVAQAHGLEKVAPTEGSCFSILSPKDPGYLGTRIK